MTNPVHEALLRQSIEDWNDWRAENRSVCPDLSGLAMSAANLRGADLSHARLRGARLIRTRLEGSDFRYADLSGASLHEADLTEADLSGANLDGAQLPGAKLRGARLVGASLRRAQITVSDLRKSDLREADLEGADLRESVGNGASLQGANLAGAEVAGCRLTECDLRGVRGLTTRQLESAIVDDTTVLTEIRTPADDEGSVDSLLAAIEALRERNEDDAVLETDVSRYHALLAKLEAKGFRTAEARIGDEDLVRGVASWDRTPGGEAFELAPLASVDRKLFHRKLDRVLKEIRRQLV
jgi:uncharacterized protein YjbI with pentapeptide repeats